MDTTYKTFHQLVGMVRSWISGRSEPANVSRDFWMPDHSCRVCYECDLQFTLFNRRHHCRLCGRVFCGACTANSVPVPLSGDDPGTSLEEREKIRVCNYCFKQWEKGIVENEIQISNLGLSSSPSELSLASTRSSVTGNSSSITFASMPYTFGPYQQPQHSSSLSPLTSSFVESNANETNSMASGRGNELVTDIEDLSSGQRGISMNRSEDEDYEHGICRLDSEAIHFHSANSYYSPVDFEDMNNDDRLHKVHPDSENTDAKSLSSSPIQYHNFESQIGRKEDEQDIGYECEASSSFYSDAKVDAEPVDFESNGLLWLPPEPEDEEDEKETVLLDDDEDGTPGEWGYLQTSGSFGSGETRNRDRSGEEHKRAMKNVVDGHFRALMAQLMQVENLPMGEEDDAESWLEIITSLSWEAATLLKPDTSKGGGMDPGGYVKVKCIASGHRRESTVVKGVVCKKNVAHRRMTSNIKKARILFLGGALEYQRVTNNLSSFDTLLQQEMDHLRMAVAKIEDHQPDVLLVEKSVSRYAQEYLLSSDISLVLNIKRPLLERIARCTGAQIASSIDNLSSQKLGFCESFHVDRVMEDLGIARQGGKKLVKTLMYFEGCPKPLGCTILLKGASGDELKKVKHVVQYGIFAAYHLAMETSFLADEGASLPELPLNSPITIALPEKAKSADRSISTVLGFGASVEAKSGGPHEPQRSKSVPNPDISLYISNAQSFNNCPPSIPCRNTSSFTNSATFHPALTEEVVEDIHRKNISYFHTYGEENETSDKTMVEPSPLNNGLTLTSDNLTINNMGSLDALGQHILSNTQNDQNGIFQNQVGVSDISSLHQDGKSHLETPRPLQEVSEPFKEEFPPSPSDNQSILVSLSSRCVWKGTVCERSHLFRIKYYGTFDKPLGRFLRDHLFDQTYQCSSCEMPSEAHVHCYTHRQGTLTISVKKLPEILLPGERDGKIWMWHRCLRCPRINGFPPATRRIVMSDAAWGLSFGKFLELSFSNHAAASRVASCGHSLHRDCLRFYGFGKMVACFRYASINVLSVYLPPPILDFNYENQEWIQKETDKVVDRVELLFSEALNALSQIEEKRSSRGMRTPESRRQIVELEGILQKEKEEFEESLLKTMNKVSKKGQPLIDILEINRLRRQLLFQSYMWDHRLIYAASLDKHSSQDHLSRSISEHEGKSIGNSENIAEGNVIIKPRKGYHSCDSFLVDAKVDKSSDYPVKFGSNTDRSETIHREPSCEKEHTANLSPSMNVCDQYEVSESKVNVRRTHSEREFPITTNLSETFDAAWTGENHTATVSVKEDTTALSDSATANSSGPFGATDKLNMDQTDEHEEPKVVYSFSHVSSTKSPENLEDSVSWLRMPFLNFYRSLNKNFFSSTQKLDPLGEYKPVYVSSFQESELQGGGRLLLPVGVNDTIIPVYDDEPASIISYALASPEYLLQVSDEGEMPKDSGDSMSLLFSDSNIRSFHSSEDTASEAHRSYGSSDEGFLSFSGSRSLDPLAYAKASHARVSFGEDGPLGKVKYSVTCYYAKRFDALRRICCPSELDFIRSLSRCKKWGAQGGKSNVFFAKTLDDRFIIKQVTKTELESFMKFAPEYFKYLSESISTGCPTCLAKVLGIYQVTSRHLKGGRESKMDVLVMENLLFGRNVTRLYDLKGSSRSRYNPDRSGRNKVLLDQNLIEAMPTSPIFLGTKAKRLLERAVWNDTTFLASVDVMDYSLLVGLDEEKHELVIGIIDFMRQYTWDKHLESWVKNSGILGGAKNSTPTVISPMQYKKRFRKAMTTYFLMVPDQWSPPSMVQSKSQSDLGEENSQGRTFVE